MNRETVNALLQKYGSPTDSAVIDWNTKPTKSRISYQSNNAHLSESKLSSISSKSIERQLGSFMMSRSQCQQFLDRVKDQLKYEEMQLLGFSQNSLRHIHDKFQENHEKIRQLILDLLDKAFMKSQKYITQQLQKHKETYPKQFDPIHEKIQNLENQIKNFHNGLRSNEYKKSIINIISRDFQNQLAQLKSSAKKAKNDYLNTMGFVEPDQQRIECIKDDLERLFKISKKIKHHQPLRNKQNNHQYIEVQESQQKQKKQGFIKSIFKFC